MMIDEVKFIFLLGSSWKRCTLSRALARAATRRLAIYGVPFGCAVCDVKIYFSSVIVGKGARSRVLWLARLLAGSLYVGVS